MAKFEDHAVYYTGNTLSGCRTPKSGPNPLTKTSLSPYFVVNSGPLADGGYITPSAPPGYGPAQQFLQTTASIDS